MCSKHYQQYKKYGKVEEVKLFRFDVSGQRFGKLVATTEYVNNKGWLCKCDCGNEKYIMGDELLRGSHLSCNQCSLNTFEIFDEHVIGYTTNGEPFYFDIDDYEKVSKYTWSISKGRVKARINKKDIFLHCFILNKQDKYIDHIDGKPINNRKSNLRLCTLQENSFNVTIKNTNTSGITGVWFNKHSGKWMAELNIDNEKHRIGFNNYIDAVIQRIKFEVKYFKKFRCNRNDEYINSILKQYGYDLYKIIEDEEEKLLKLKTE